MNKSENKIPILFIVIFIVINYICTNKIGLLNYKSTLIYIVLSIIILIYLFITKKIEYYGLNKLPDKHTKYHVPIILITILNVLMMINYFIYIGNTKIDLNHVIWPIISLIFLAFLKEIIFRGFLLKILQKINPSLIYISIIPLGIFNVIFAKTDFEYISLFYTLVYSLIPALFSLFILEHTGSLLPGIILTSITNVLSTFPRFPIPAAIECMIVIFIICFCSGYIEKQINKNKKVIN